MTLIETIVSQAMWFAMTLDVDLHRNFMQDVVF